MKIPFRLPTGRDFRNAVAEHQRRIQERLKDPAVQAEVAKARAEATAAARLLKERFGATRVRLFGSLARGDTWKESTSTSRSKGFARANSSKPSASSARTSKPSSG